MNYVLLMMICNVFTKQKFIIIFSGKHRHKIKVIYWDVFCSAFVWFSGIFYDKIVCIIWMLKYYICIVGTINSFFYLSIVCYLRLICSGSCKDVRRPPSLSELTSMIFNMELTHLGSEAFNYLIFIFLDIFI